MHLTIEPPKYTKTDRTEWGINDSTVFISFQKDRKVREDQKRNSIEKYYETSKTWQACTEWSNQQLKSVYSSQAHTKISLGSAICWVEREMVTHSSILA